MGKTREALKKQISRKAIKGAILKAGQYKDHRHKALSKCLFNRERKGEVLKKAASKEYAKGNNLQVRIL
jgi:hypothetical protein